jgi:hypothetical protein
MIESHHTQSLSLRQTSLRPGVRFSLGAPGCLPPVAPSLALPASGGGIQEFLASQDGLPLSLLGGRLEGGFAPKDDLPQG